MRTRLPSPSPHHPPLVESGRWFAAMRIPAAVLDRQGTIVAANPAWLTLLGHSTDPAMGRTLGRHLPTCDGATVELHDAVGRRHRYQVSISPVDDGELLVQLIDVEERCRLVDQLDAMTTTDPLTGLLNRRGLFDRIESHLGRCRVHGVDGGALLIDLDRLKLINDSHGHLMGDMVLTAVGGAIADAIGPSDAAGRIGGDEFAVLVRAGSVSDMVALATEISASVRSGTRGLARRMGLEVTVSIGASQVRRLHRDASALLDEADRAMYRCKAQRYGAA